MSDLIADIVLFTVNKHETEQLKSAFAFNGKIIMKSVGDLTFPYDDFGVVAGARVVHIQTPMADLNTIQFARHAAHAWRPSLLAAVGIAWGSKKKQNDQHQAIGDVLVASTLQDAAHHKNKQGEIQPRGNSWSMSESIQRIVSSSYQSWIWQTDVAFPDQISKPKLYQDEMLSLPELIDDKNLQSSLLRAWPNACGGEMEGRGLVSEAVQSKCEWLIVKAVCDWGFDKNTDELQKEINQAQAARSAATFLRHTLDHGLAQHAIAHSSISTSLDGHYKSVSVTQSISGIGNKVVGYAKTVHF